MVKSSKIIIVCGHYGTGKSNFSLNLALAEHRAGNPVTLVDLDLVNPYFLSSGYRESLEKEGIKVIAPKYAGTNVDIPAVGAEINAVFSMEGTAILDIGGDDAGATVLGRYAGQLEAAGYEMLYVVNKYRNLAATREDAVQILREIETVSRCRATGIVNNSHLKQLTTRETIEESIPFAKEVAEALELPIVYQTAPVYIEGVEELLDNYHLQEKYFPVEILVKTPWE